MPQWYPMQRPLAVDSSLSSPGWRYNDAVLVRYAVVAALLSAAMSAQTPPPPCPANRPVDEIIADIHEQQSKKKNRNKNPLPTGICIAGWCRGTSKTAPTVPKSLPAPTVQASPPAVSADSGTSSSQDPAKKCNEIMEQVLEAAHNVEVGDYYFEQRNFKAAQMRYKDAAEDKPDDPAIHVRLGRALEKLNQSQEAIEEYKQGQQLAGTGKWHDEARDALVRLQRSSGS